MVDCCCCWLSLVTYLNCSRFGIDANPASAEPAALREVSTYVFHQGCSCSESLSHPHRRRNHSALIYPHQNYGYSEYLSHQHQCYDCSGFPSHPHRRCRCSELPSYPHQHNTHSYRQLHPGESNHGRPIFFPAPSEITGEVSHACNHDEVGDGDEVFGDDQNDIHACCSCEWSNWLWGCEVFCDDQDDAHRVLFYFGDIFGGNLPANARQLKPLAGCLPVQVFSCDLVGAAGPFICFRSIYRKNRCFLYRWYCALCAVYMLMQYICLLCCFRLLCYALLSDYYV